MPNCARARVAKKPTTSSSKPRLTPSSRKREEIGLDGNALVHGEFRRNDMVGIFRPEPQRLPVHQEQQFQSYGTRCVKPRSSGATFPAANRLPWNGPRTPSQDRPCDEGHAHRPGDHPQLVPGRARTSPEGRTKQLALAIRDEVLDLRAAGIKGHPDPVRPPLREKLPLRKVRLARQNYLDWAVPAFRLSALRRQTDHPDPHPVMLLRVQRHHPRHRRDGYRRDLLQSLRGDLVVLDAIHDAHFEDRGRPGRLRHSLPAYSFREGDPRISIYEDP